MPDIQSKEKESNTLFIGVEYGLVPTEIYYGTKIYHKPSTEGWNNMGNAKKYVSGII